MNRRHALAIAAASGMIVLAGAAAVGANSSVLGSGKDNVGKLSPLQLPAQSPAAITAVKPSEITVVVDPRSGSATVVTSPTAPAGSAAPAAPSAPRAEPRVTAPASVAPPAASGPAARTDDSAERSTSEDDHEWTGDRVESESEYEGRDDDD